MPLPDHARCRIVLSDPALPDDQLASALDKLFTQFAREQRCDAWSCTRELDGAVLVLAWTPDVSLSGCSHDKINGVLAAHERGFHRLLAPPPLCIQIEGRWRCVDRRELRRLATGTTGLIDHRIEQLGAWRSRGVTTVGASWAAGLLNNPTAA